MLGYAELLQEVYGALPAISLPIATRRFNCKHVLRLIDPVHDISKIEEFRAITSSEGYRAKRGDDVVGDAV